MVERMKFRGVILVAFALVAMPDTENAGPVGGRITGKIIYEGTAPKMRTIDMTREPSCAKLYPTPPTSESVVTGAGNTLAGVLIYVSAGIPDEGAPSTAAVLTQKGCRYAPHILPLQVNQELRIYNEDDVVHNVFTLAKLNPDANKSQMPGAAPLTEKYTKPEFIPVKCNIHPWMHGTLAVLKNSHYAVSGEAGTFTLANLPPGKYTVTAWQEAYGKQSQEVTISGGETKAISFVFQAKPQ
jgi:plastocyanin